MAADALAGVDDISTLVAYYDHKRKPSASPEIGQIVFTPVLNTERRPYVADAQRSDPHTHRSAELTIRPMNDAADFRKKQRLPIAALNLGETEELVVARAKQRPCLVLARSDGIDSMTLPEGVQRNKALNAFGDIYCLAPIYSASTGDKSTSFGPVMTARIKCMMYPEFVFAPQSGLIIDTHSVIRLDRIFWSHVFAASEPQPLFVTNEILGICWNQLKILTEEPASGEYMELRELMLSCLPAECNVALSA
jgi:hypothetical protein